MAMIEFTHKGDFKKTSEFLQDCKKFDVDTVLNAYGRAGVEALAAVTPIDTGKTAASWSYEIVKDDSTIKISWNNSNTNKWANVAILLQYGHATGTGGWVEGIDYINPALKPIFQKMADRAWEAVTKRR